MTPPARPYLNALTGIRFLAALHVVFYHHRDDAFMVAMPGFVRQVVNGGYVAVGLFFVLSGFILTYTYLGGQRQDLDRRSFWVARLARIYPVYLLSFAVGAPLFFRYSVATVAPLSDEVGIGFGALATVLSMTLAWSPATVRLIAPWNMPAWSLSAESFFYVLFPALAVYLLRRSTRLLFAILVGGALLALVAPVAFLAVSPVVDALPAADQEAWGMVVSYNPLVRLPEFLLGIVAGHLLIRAARSFTPSRRAACSLMVVLASLLVVVILQAGDRIPSALMTGLLAPIFAVLVFGLAAGGPGLAWLLSQPQLVLLGEASYAIYLLHGPVWGWTALMAREGWGVDAYTQGPWFFALYLTVVIAISIATFHAVENPARTAFKRLLDGPSGDRPTIQSLRRGWRKASSMAQ